MLLLWKCLFLFEDFIGWRHTECIFFYSVQSLKWQMYQVEEIQFPDDECSILLDILSSHARAFPREIRNSFPNMDLSFLLLPQGK